MNGLFKDWRSDLSAGLVVFLVALPLCLGIGLPSTNLTNISGLPNIFAGLIAGVVGGIVIGLFSGSKLGVSGPAAGLITIVIASITTLGSYQAFLLAVLISGVLQLIAGFFNAGVIAGYIPSSVIKGMLAAIGVTLILKEIPHLVGYDADFMGDESFLQSDGHNTLSEIFYALNGIQFGSLIIGLFSLFLLLIWDLPFIKRIKIIGQIPGALVAVLIAVGLNLIFNSYFPDLKISKEHLVQIPVLTTISDFPSLFTFPDFTFLSNPNVYIIALTLAIVGSLETLLSVEATDKLDPKKNITPKNRELRAQGIGNMVSSLIGGLPVTQVIVRSSANINSGGKSKLSTIIHGFFLLSAILFIPTVLNLIPLSVLGAVLILVGYKLTKVSLFKQMFGLGQEQFIPFITTILGVLFTDLLKGIGIGMAFAIFYILKSNYKNHFTKEEKQDEVIITLSEEVTFLNKSGIQEMLLTAKPNSKLTIDGSKCQSIDHDVLEMLEEFNKFGYKNKNIDFQMLNIKYK
jgi:MFS superfamily sulfate permease-like transporter